MSSATSLIKILKKEVTPAFSGMAERSFRILEGARCVGLGVRAGGAGGGGRRGRAAGGGGGGAGGWEGSMSSYNQMKCFP